MSILDAFRRPADPTERWREDLKVGLLADLDRFELNGVAFGEEVERLSFLGRSESRPFEYPSKGLLLDVDEASLDGFVLALRRDAEFGAPSGRRVQSFAGRVRIDGRDLEPHELRGEGDFVGAWGDPFWRDEDEDEILLFFEFPDREIQVELTLEGVPLVLIASPAPLMADPEQRAQYGVDKAWPPLAQQ